MLTGKTALGTGGTSGIGLVTAKLLRDNGAHVAVVGRSANTFEFVRDTIGRSVITIKADVLSCDDLQKVVGGRDAMSTLVQGAFHWHRGQSDAVSRSPIKKTALLAFLFLGVIWGSNFIFMKWAAEEISPAQIVLLRSVFGFLPIFSMRYRNGCCAGSISATLTTSSSCHFWRPQSITSPLRRARRFSRRASRAC